ncbi:acyltransferase family protein [Roseateles violae]|uniref:Heparan-alpha-glucosaminide N-acetyltransferase domain-containing protein n=1 Tax=Roseateles violae TaxID=3058042 RepID=A0ABT8DNZ7_9BURK|nr:heparan-alpha-glucosaminide N-acetyltransferase domain-containing protein [Pelomonas sp. PFR6]MDN3919731.1 heparan-alpha-glucosaminide N-acetyltransferase domain-containing protein [Pelomonas sp. PFR6]
MSASAAASPRLASVDALRGLAVAAMLLVNNPGDWGHVYAPLEHAAWHGCTPTDLIFPFFLFIVGVSIALSLGGRIERGDAAAPMRRTVLERALRIVLLGLALHLLAWWLMDKPEFRPMGVLQRIGLCFALTGLAALSLSARRQWLLLLGLLLGYAALLLWGGPLSKEGNLASRLDAALLGRWAYEWQAATGQGHDPEGILSTLGALATCLLGLRAGELLRRGGRRALALLGLAALALGWAWTPWLPLNKQLWTGSFVLWTGGWACLALALAHELVDRRGWPALGRSFGVNAIAAYAGAWMCTVLLEGFGLMQPLYAGGFGWLQRALGPEQASLAFALAFVLVWALIVRQLDRRRIYIKV